MINERDAFFLFSTLERYIPLDQPATLHPRTNRKGKKCIRYEATTKGKHWIVDFYSLDFI